MRARLERHLDWLVPTVLGGIFLLGLGLSIWDWKQKSLEYHSLREDCDTVRGIILEDAGGHLVCVGGVVTPLPLTPWRP